MTKSESIISATGLQLIKSLGSKKINGISRKIGLFLCPFCKTEVEKKLSDIKIIKSCGCMRKVFISGSLINNKNNLNKGKHGDTKKENKNNPYPTWLDMKQRCSNSKRKSYKYYGGKGIKVCDEWKDYINFKNWALSNGFVKGLTIDRIDSNKGYCPENCHWITRSENTKKMFEENHICK